MNHWNSMKAQPLGQSYSRTVNILIFIFPIVINSLQVAGDIVLLILAMMGIYVAISRKLSPFTINEIKVFSYLTFSYFIAICSSVLFSGQAVELAHYIPRDFYFLFAPFIALALYKSELNINYLLVGVKAALLILGVIIYIQVLSESDRPSGVMNPAVFGNLSVALFFIAISFIRYESFKHKIFTFLSLLSGCFIIVESGTRGAWISFVILMGFYLYFFYKQKTKFSLRSKIITVIIMVSMLFFGSINQIIVDRSNLVSSEISSWMSGDTKPTSVGLRLNMYKKAINNIESVPFFGYGLRTSNISLFKDDSSEMGIISSRYNHLHNGFLTNYYNGGFPLLGTLLLLLFVPLRIFLKANIQNRKNPVFISGALLILGYSTFGMVNILLGDTYMNGFFVFYLAVFIVLTKKIQTIIRIKKTSLKVF